VVNDLVLKAEHGFDVDVDHDTYARVTQGISPEGSR